MNTEILSGGLVREFTEWSSDMKLERPYRRSSASGKFKAHRLHRELDLCPHTAGSENDSLPGVLPAYGLFLHLVTSSKI